MRIPLQLGLAVSLLAAVAVAQEKTKPASKSGVLVVNILRLIDESDEGRDLVAKLREEMTTKKQQLTEEGAKLQERVKVLLDAKPADRGNDYYIELQQAMETKARLDMEQNLFMAKKGDELNRALQQLLIGAQDEAKKEMKERGGEIVLLTKTGPIEVVADKDFQQELFMRRVLCFDESLDITGDVIQRMNAWYKEHKTAQGPAKREGATEGEATKEAPAKETPKGTPKDAPPKGAPAKEGAGKPSGN